MKTVLLTVVLVFVAGLLLAVRVLTVKGGRFPSHHHRPAASRHNNRKDG